MKFIFYKTIVFIQHHLFSFNYIWLNLNKYKNSFHFYYGLTLYNIFLTFYLCIASLGEWNIPFYGRCFFNIHSIMILLQCSIYTYLLLFCGDILIFANEETNVHWYYHVIFIQDLMWINKKTLIIVAQHTPIK